ncbi:hypothetical protein, partial [Noviherbaspirillum sp.]|uniref:hypothetical protein n=1 Tax=Noviherbaspirillum sp. TaxID=1926288 RepID=UPI002FE33A29
MFISKVSVDSPAVLTIGFVLILKGNACIGPLRRAHVQVERTEAGTDHPYIVERIDLDILQLR